MPITGSIVVPVTGHPVADVTPGLLIKPLFLLRRVVFPGVSHINTVEADLPVVVIVYARYRVLVVPESGSWHRFGPVNADTRSA